MSNTISRKQNSSKSALSALLRCIIKIVLQFLLRSVFILYLSVEYLGINSAIAGVLNLLSVTELGIGSVITFHLYKPVAQNDIAKTNSILRLYKKIYLIIGFVILAIGLCIVPFLNHLVADIQNIDINIYYVYILALLGTVSTYFCAYRDVLFIAYQQQYKANLLNTILSVITIAIQAIIILVFKNYYVFLYAQTFSAIFINVITYFYSKKVYPQVSIKDAEILDKDTKKEVFKNVKGMFYHKLSYSVLQGTDSIIISTFIGATILGLYSNYSLFTVNLSSAFCLMITAFTGSIGNLIAENNSEKSYSVYKILKMAFFWLSGFFAISLFILLGPAINLWANIGNWDTSINWTFDTFTTLIICINFFLYTSRCITGVFRETIGNFHKDRFKGIAEAIINVVASLLLVKPLGIAGVLLGTIISCVLTSLWVDPYMIYKYHFKKPLWKHFVDIGIYFLITALAGFATFMLCSLISGSGIAVLLIKFLICLLVPNLIYLLTLMPTKEFKGAILMAKDLFKRLKPKKNTVNEDSDQTISQKEPEE